jgi:hypothetical protein
MGKTIKVIKKEFGFQENILSLKETKHHYITKLIRRSKGSKFIKGQLEYKTNCLTKARNYFDSLKENELYQEI